MKNKKYLPVLLNITALLITASIFILVLSNSQKTAEIQMPDNKPQVLGIGSAPIRGENAEPENQEIKQIRDLKLEAVTAKSFLAFDLQTGQILAEKNIRQKVPIASLTKLLTAFVVYQQADTNSEVTITTDDASTFSPKLNLIVGDKIKLLDLFNSMLVGSDNDAALALAHFVSNQTGQNFVNLMNLAAKNLKMDSGNFNNPTGFDDSQNYSTAEDLKKLVAATQSLSAFTNLGKTKKYVFQSLLKNNYQSLATNRLPDAYPDIEAVKTGYTEESKGSMIVKLAVKDRRIILIVLNSKDREKDTLLLRGQLLQSFEF